MEPLRVVAHLGSEIANPGRLPALDALLAYAQATWIEERPPYDESKPCPEVDITHALAAARDDAGRVLYHLATVGLGRVEQHLRGRFVNRRMPIDRMQYLSTRGGTLNTSGGPAKSFRLPLETGWLAGDRVTWFCVGDAGEIERLLGPVTHLGKRRAVGLGRVARWEVRPCPSWGDGFPVLFEGVPLRNLPLDALPPEARAPFESWGTITYPYRRHLEVACLVPPFTSDDTPVPEPLLAWA